MDYKQQFDVIVIGGGHAGTEAASAAARIGCNTLLISHSIETIGQMSCNPAIGGIGKSHLVREIDACDGLMAKITDLAGIQFRILNQRKGPAVRATRAQADRILYRQFMRHSIETTPNLTVFQQPVCDLIIEQNRVEGVVLAMGLKLRSKSVVVTAGTFLAGQMHIGKNQQSGGRAGDPASNDLASSLRDKSFRTSRLKTGTPPRIDFRSVELDLLPKQPGDDPTPYMSMMSKGNEHPRQTVCFLSNTTEKTRDIILENLHLSPMHAGIIDGVGPRYCPSIEEKVVRFADKPTHQIFLEPEGLTSHELYPNGVSTSLPYEVQLDIIRSLEGCANASITRPGYAIEYDFFDPRDLKSTLESKLIRNLYFAGQINGTTGYEEAGAQGLLAGANAALSAFERPPWIIGRDQGYIGVMVDDLTALGTQEPYRMFTSRAEYRLALREDNADIRFTERARELGMVSEQRWKHFNYRQEQIEKETQRLKDTWIRPDKQNLQNLNAVLKSPLVKEVTAHDLLKRPEVHYQDLVDGAGIEPHQNPSISCQIEILIKYSGYIDRQTEEIQKLKNNEQVKIPSDLNYSLITGLSNEVREKLVDYQPQTLAQASRIPGVTSAAISLLLVHIKKLDLMNLAS
ncbi:MAG TPA: tRNA uridine-5-carboxymethylaminomethyl(34) synthesis enzyme MnmG [Gammaproteobacteria bacterium]|nr:tRNA uridine-5-carboxymethylaminomethyl(34) synthesis enzyme MnmG [Gammaproteobacteria bacterium]